MFQTRTGRRQGIAYALLVAVSMILLALSGTAPMAELRRGFGFAVAPIQETLSRGTRTVTSIAAVIGEVDQLRRQNEDLQRRVDELQITARQYESILVQNEQLTELLEVRSLLDYRTVPAEVMSREASRFERVVGLNRGADAGISVGDAVLAGGGALVGQVVEVGANFSRVMLISDSRSVVIGMLEASRSTGEIQGALERPLTMSKIPSTELVELDETVLTAGIDLGSGIRSPFPRGLLIGRVVDVRRNPNEIVQTALVQPATALERLEYVLVITDYEGGLPGPDASPAPSPGASPP